MELKHTANCFASVRIRSDLIQGGWKCRGSRVPTMIYRYIHGSLLKETSQSSFRLLPEKREVFSTRCYDADYEATAGRRVSELGSRWKEDALCIFISRDVVLLRGT